MLAMNGHSVPPKQGFSIVELMVIVSIAGVLLAIGVPSFMTMIQNHKLTVATNALFSAVNLARSEAIHRGARVDLVPAGDGSNWQNGWLVFVDKDNDQRPDTDETVIFSYPEVDADMRIAATFTDSKVKYLAFTGSGRTRTNASSQTSQSGNWRLDIGKQSRKVVINFLGRPRVCDPVKEPTTC
jgi:type IV fimbrial biogenesis protein FimT